MSDRLSHPSVVRLNDDATRLVPMTLGGADPFAAQRAAAWAGDDALVVGRVDWAGGRLDVTAYPHTELAIVQSGTLVVEATGAPHPLRADAGQAVVLPRGAALSLRADGPVRWAFCAAQAPSAAEPAPPCLLLDAGAALSPSAPPAAEVLLGPTPACRNANAFTDEATNLRIGVWDSTPYTRRAVPHRMNELMHILDGAVTLSGAGGASLTAGAGDTVFVPRGTLCAWSSAVHVRKIYAVQ